MQSLNIEKSCNALFSEAKPAVFSISGSLVSQLFKKKDGGLWVGGTFTANGEWLTFSPGILNLFAHSEVDSVRIHVSEVRNISCESGFFTDIITIHHVRGEFKFRCYGAKEIANTLLAHFQQLYR